MVKIFQNLPLKLLSLGAAVMLWIFVVGIENSVYKFPEALGMEVLNLDKNVSVSSQLPPVNIFIKDDQQVVSTLTKNDFTVSVDLSGLKAGEHQAPVSATAKKPQVRIVKVEPSQITVNLAPVAEKEVKISAAVQGAPLSGYAAKDIKLEFDRAKIIGAQTYLDRIEELEANLVLTGTENADISQNITLSLPAQNAALKENIKIVPPEVLFNLKIIPMLQQKNVPVALKLGGVDDQELWAKMINVTPSSLTIEGDEKNIRLITAVETAELDIPGLLKQNAAVKLALDLPAGVTAVGGATEVTVELKSESVERKTLSAPVVLSGRAAGFKASSVSPPTVSVTLTGASTLINNLKEGSIVYTIDLAKISAAGALSVDKAGFNLPPGYSILDFKPKLITLK